MFFGAISLDPSNLYSFRYVRIFVRCYSVVNLYYNKQMFQIVESLFVGLFLYD